MLYSRKSQEMKERQPPPDEFELSLFGPGVGECIVLHLGDGNWAVVDSCENAARDKAIALEYLEGMEVDVASQVVLIVASHWDDDHIRGISQLFRFSSSAEFACSGAIRHREFWALVLESRKNKLVEHSSGAAEFADILDILRQRLGGRTASGPHYWATENQILWEGGNAIKSQIRALSPSAQAITNAQGQFAQLLPQIGDQPTRRFPKTSKANDQSVVLLVKTSGINVLLGADLEASADDRRGWKAVIQSRNRPQVTSSAYKVAHHGSDNADDPAIWNELLIENPLAVVAPYGAGRNPRPSEEDVQRIKTRTERLYCTVWPPSNSAPTYRGAVGRILKGATKSRRAIRRTPGHIRLRVKVGQSIDDAEIELFDGAKAL